MITAKYSNNVNATEIMLDRQTALDKARNDTVIIRVSAAEKAVYQLFANWYTDGNVSEMLRMALEHFDESHYPIAYNRTETELIHAWMNELEQETP